MLVFLLRVIRLEFLYPLPLLLNYRSCTNTYTEPNEFMSVGSTMACQRYVRGIRVVNVSHVLS